MTPGPIAPARNAAFEYHRAGLNVIPLTSGTKKPAGSWTRWTRERQSEDDLLRLFSCDATNIGIVCGSVSAKLVVRDFDDGDAFERRLREESEFRSIVQRCPLVRTRRGYHVYARFPFPIPTRRLADGEFRGNGAQVVAPPSVVDGHTYTWLKDLTHLDVLTHSELAVLLGRQLSITDTFGLTAAQREVLNGRVPIGHRSDEENAVVVSLVGQGATDEDIHEVFERTAASGTHYVDAGASRGKWLQRNIDIARSRSNGNPSHVDLFLDRYQFWAVREPGISLNERAHRLAVVEIARRTGKVTRLGISVRQLEERSGYSRTRAAKFLRSGTGVTRVQAGRYGRAAEFDLVPAPERLDAPRVTVEPRPTDVFGTSALPPAAWLAYAYLRIIGTAQTASEIAAALGISAQTIRKHLSFLFATAIIQRENARPSALWRASSPPSTRQWSDLAAAMGTHGNTHRKRQTHELERELYTWREQRRPT